MNTVIKMYTSNLARFIGESSKFSKSRAFETSILKLAVCLLNVYNFTIKWSNVVRQTEYKSEKLFWSP